MKLTFHLSSFFYLPSASFSSPFQEIFSFTFTFKIDKVGHNSGWKKRKWKSLSRVWLFVTPWTIQFRQNTGVGCHSLLQGIFPTQGSNPGLLHCRWVLYQLGSPRILEWVAYPFSSGSSWPRNQTEVSCFAGRFRYPWFKISRSLFLGSSDFPEKKKKLFSNCCLQSEGPGARILET